MRILIVDDDIVIRRVLLQVMRPYGQCDQAGNGSEAIISYVAASYADPYGLMLLDIEMPGIDGIQTLKTIRGIEQRCGVPTARRARIVMVTAHHERNTIIEAFRDQCEGYIVKPIVPADVVVSLAKIGIVLNPFGSSSS
jgi:two-component system, chemotaxis family, chemotaxis protein CheY